MPPPKVTLDVPFAAATPPSTCDGGIHFVSLPWDHAYIDLQQVADDIPGALRVQVYDPTDTTPDCQQQIGLSRTSTRDPWTGTNVSLMDRRGQGILVAVEAAVEWTPRSLCAAFSGGPTTNVPPVANAGGPYGSSLCNGGVIGIWLDGSGSFDPDSTGALSYQWTSTCAGTITDPRAEVTAALFDCNPCDSLNCGVTLTVTDGGLASGSDTEPIYSRKVNTCVAAGNSLRVARGPGGLVVDWSLAPVAQNYVLLGSDTKEMNGPRNLLCGPELRVLDYNSESTLELYTVDAMNEACAPR